MGAVQPLGDDDDSPFLGQLPPGASSLAVESGLFRALAHPYDPPPSDFLLLRSPVRGVAAPWALRRGWGLRAGDGCRRLSERAMPCPGAAGRPAGGEAPHRYRRRPSPAARACCPPGHRARLQAGTMQLRELGGSVVVGQELPFLRVPAPNAREVK